MRLIFKPGAAFVVFPPLHGSRKVSRGMVARRQHNASTFEDDKPDSPKILDVLFSSTASAVVGENHRPDAVQCLFKTKFLVAADAVARRGAVCPGRLPPLPMQSSSPPPQPPPPPLLSLGQSVTYRSYVKTSDLLEPSFQATPAASCGSPLQNSGK